MIKAIRSVKGVGKSLIRHAAASSAGFHAVHLVHRIVAFIGATLASCGASAANQRSGVLIICPPGGGNIGDQALVESASWNSEGPVTLVVRAAGNYEVPSWLEGRSVRKVALPGLLYGMSLAHVRDVLRFLSLSRRAESVVVIGADIMDGCYNSIASVNRWSLAVLASYSGGRSTVLGFSWNSTPTASSTAGLLCANRTVALWARDPISLGRVHQLGARNAQLCADIVYAHPSESLDPDVRRLPEVLSNLVAASRRYALVNASGYIGGDEHVLSEYRALIDTFYTAGLEVVLLPHVMRGRSDLECLRVLRQDCDAILVDHLLSPAQVSNLAANAAIVVTGRMHLAVLASMTGTPVLTLATQGKVDGLYSLLRRPEWVLDSKTQFSRGVAAALAEITAGDFRYPAAAVENIGRLARAPFGTPQPVEGPSRL